MKSTTLDIVIDSYLAQIMNNTAASSYHINL